MTTATESANLPTAITTEAVLERLRAIIDPEAGLNIVDMGLIYETVIAEDELQIRMTMTSPACPVGDLLVEEVEACLRDAYPSLLIRVELTFEPPWSPSMLSESARNEFGW